MTTASPQTARGANRWLSIASLWIGLILLVIEGLIGTRLVLKMAGASEGNGFVDLIYNLSGPLVRPFEGIFDARTVGDDGRLDRRELSTVSIRRSMN